MVLEAPVLKVVGEDGAAGLDLHVVLHVHAQRPAEDLGGWPGDALEGEAKARKAGEGWDRLRTDRQGINTCL